jgi:hypothetical protein
VHDPGRVSSTNGAPKRARHKPALAIADRVPEDVVYVAFSGNGILAVDTWARAIGSARHSQLGKPIECRSLSLLFLA